MGGASSILIVSVFCLEGAGTVAFVGFRSTVLVVFFVAGIFDTYKSLNSSQQL